MQNVTDAIDVLPEKLREAARTAVRSDEHVLWAGQPAGKMSNRVNFSLAPVAFGIMFFLLGAALIGAYVWRELRATHVPQAIVVSALLIAAFGLLVAGGTMKFWS